MVKWPSSAATRWGSTDRTISEELQRQEGHAPLCVCVCVSETELETRSPEQVIVFLPVTPEPWGRASWDLPVLERGPTSAQSSTANHPPRLPSTSYQHFPFLSPHFPLLSSSLVSRGSKDCITTRKLPTEGHTSTKMKKKKKNSDRRFCL